MTYQPGNPSGRGDDALDSVAELTSAGDVGSVPTGRLIPRLGAQDPRTGRWVHVHLQDPATRTLLRPPCLYALADAILAGRRPEPHAHHAHHVAQTLRQMAGAPFAAGPIPRR
ncbi:hypothetical protein ACFOY2_32770 [Nonomuraea purpurea]|uniref:Uncharacterized protein n=1 Tax=Nonomuraea purpurea TaxID=1849276 RepID=A0ABV8GDP7_9ACTN